MDFHNRRNIRQVNHDYSKPCSYFITVNVKFGQCLFGKAVSSTEIELNELGQTAQKFWIEIPDHFNHVRMDEFVIMPNHMHGIIHIGDVSGNMCGHDMSCPYMPTPSKPNQFGPLPKGSLAVVIGQYKSSVTRWANQNRFGGLFSWHSRFYDRILSDSSSLMAAQIYIRQNPEKWWAKYQDQNW